MTDTPVTTDKRVVPVWNLWLRLVLGVVIFGAGLVRLFGGGGGSGVSMLLGFVQVAFGIYWAVGSFRSLAEARREGAARA